jgi:hypothetical protein
MPCAIILSIEARLVPLGLYEHLCLAYDTEEGQFAAALPYLVEAQKDVET